MVGRSRSTLHAMPSLRHESEMSMSNLPGTQVILVKVTVAGIYGIYYVVYNVLSTVLILNHLILTIKSVM